MGHIQEIVDIKLMFELFACFLFIYSIFILITNGQKRGKPTIKQEKVQNDY